MSGSCTSSNPPEPIFTSWPVATTACLQQLGRQTRWWENRLAHLCKRTATKQPQAGPALCCTDFELLTFRRGLGNSLRTFFLASVGFRIPQNSRNSERRCCVDESQASVALGLYYSSYFAFCWPQLPDSQFNSWLIWFITCSHGLKVQWLWWLRWVSIQLWYVLNVREICYWNIMFICNKYVLGGDQFIVEYILKTQL